MMTLSLTLPDQLAQELEQESKERNVEATEIIRKALRGYLYSQRMDRIRAEMRPYAEKAGFLSEDDIFREIS